ncbi:MAG TPA: GntR family transcriptional regulator [Longimicrobiales bacterium]|nr:GntR family transcriptional regulator [Longimicrobiales bacterium]
MPKGPATRKANRSASSSSQNGRGDRVTQAYHELRELIVRGRMAPGTRIIETDVATKLGVSRTPVRGALQRLQQEGYIVAFGSGQQSRLAVAPLTEDDAVELFAIVGEIEGLGARWSAQLDETKRADVTADLQKLNDELSQVATEPRPDHHRIFELDQGFHRRYVQGAAGKRLLALHDAIKPQSERYVRLYISALVDEIGTSVREHAVIIDAIAAGEGEAAQSAVRYNWHNAAVRLARVIQSLGERGTW